jgi:hypothetical protein
VEGYDKWVERAPASWKLDNFLRSHEPIVVTSRYGQNAAIVLDSEGSEEEEAEFWSKDRDFSKIAYMSFALATLIE